MNKILNKLGILFIVAALFAAAAASVSAAPYPADGKVWRNGESIDAQHFERVISGN